MDNYPETIEFEIDRDALRRSLITRSVCSSAFLMAMFMGLGLVFSMGVGSDAGVVRGFQVFGYWLAAVLIVGSSGYFFYTHPRIRRAVKDVDLRVEGPYLLVRTYDLLSGQWHDRKLHFKIIVDYDIVEDTWMRRYGIQSLRLSTLAGGMSSIIIPAVKDCRKTRNLLNEIDHARENS
jgi:hypothetical protein